MKLNKIEKALQSILKIAQKNNIKVSIYNSDELTHYQINAKENKTPINRIKRIDIHKPKKSKRKK